MARKTLPLERTFLTWSNHYCGTAEQLIQAGVLRDCANVPGAPDRPKTCVYVTPTGEAIDRLEWRRKCEGVQGAMTLRRDSTTSKRIGVHVNVSAAERARRAQERNRCLEEAEATAQALLATIPADLRFSAKRLTDKAGIESVLGVLYRDGSRTFDGQQRRVLNALEAYAAAVIEKHVGGSLMKESQQVINRLMARS